MASPTAEITKINLEPKNQMALYLSHDINGLSGSEAIHALLDANMITETRN